MSKRGRRLKLELARTAKGRITRAARVEDVTSAVVDARRKHFHIGKERARDPHMVSLLGRLRAGNDLSELQHATGLVFQSLIRLFVVETGAPRPVPRALSVAQDGRSFPGPSDSPERIEAAQRRCQAVLEAIGGERSEVRTIVWRVCIEEADVRLKDDEVGALRQGLNAIARALARSGP